MSGELWLIAGGFLLFCLAMFGLGLAFGPRPGSWAAQAPETEPGRKLTWTLYAAAAVHIILGAMVGIVGVRIDGPVFGPILIGLVLACFYVALAHSTVFTRLLHQRARTPGSRPRRGDRAA